MYDLRESVSLSNRENTKETNNASEKKDESILSFLKLEQNSFECQIFKLTDNILANGRF